jgi:pimeloyl-ACP methyl ester carboxylesterase
MRGANHNETGGTVERHEFTHDNIRFSYLDSGGDAPVLIAMHAHWMDGATFIPLADALETGWRVIAPDQRGHGESGHATRYTRDDYIGDLESLFELLALDSAVLLGNSLGGVNAFQFAARHPDKVRGMIIEEIGAVVTDFDMNFMRAWSGTFPTRDALEQRIGQRYAPYLRQAFRETRDGWKLAFEPIEIMTSQKNLVGAYWDDWIASTCPALILRGADSRVTTAAVAQEMVERRANTQLLTLPGGHILHSDNFPAFLTAVKSFLHSLP